MDFKIDNVEQFNNINEAHFHQPEKVIDKNSPHIVICPQCGGESYRFNEYCYNGKCTFGIKQYFDYQEWHEKKQPPNTFIKQKPAFPAVQRFLKCMEEEFFGLLNPTP